MKIKSLAIYISILYIFIIIEFAFLFHKINESTLFLEKEIKSRSIFKNECYIPIEKKYIIDNYNEKLYIIVLAT